MSFATIPEMFQQICYRKPEGTAFRYKVEGAYVDIKYRELKVQVENFAMGLLELGFRAGDRIGMASENRIEWIISDFAISGIGAVSVPVFPTLTSKQEEFIFSDCGVTAIIVSNKFQLAKVLEFKDRVSSLRHIIVFSNDFDAKDPAVKSFASILKRGESLKDQSSRAVFFSELCAKVKPDDMLTLIYTSGTTGNPKGVMLSHKNVVANLVSINKLNVFDENDIFLSYLPFCHSYERSTGYYAAFSLGSEIALAESIETVGANILEIKPTIMTTVPRLLEIIKKKIFAAMEKVPAHKRKIFKWAVGVGKAYIKSLETEKISWRVKTQYKLADKLVFSKIREKTGGRLKKFISGGAALPPEVCEFFIFCGLEVLEGYGLTESSPVISVSMPENYEIGTIGMPIPGVEVKIAEDGEILARGDNIMLGYWNDKIATDEAIDEDGWLYTGDIGVFTAKGNIKITDRKKNILVSSGGKNIAPQPIENVLSQSMFIEHVLLVGDKREYVTALITPDFEQLKSYASKNGISFTEENELISNTQIIKAIKTEIDILQKDFAKYERVRKFKLLSAPFSVENGELTPKLSIKRHVVERKYSELIEQMYDIH